MKIWKRNAIVSVVLVLICSGVYLNWSASQRKSQDLMDTLDADVVMGDGMYIPGEETTPVVGNLNESGPVDYFAQIRLSRQEARDSAVGILQETMAAEGDEPEMQAAAETLESLVGDALRESQIESLIIAKGYADCVAYMGEDTIDIAVAAPVNGLSESDVALISDIVAAQTEYDLSEMRIIEVK